MKMTSIVLLCFCARLVAACGADDTDKGKKPGTPATTGNETDPASAFGSTVVLAEYVKAGEDKYPAQIPLAVAKIIATRCIGCHNPKDKPQRNFTTFNTVTGFPPFAFGNEKWSRDRLLSELAKAIEEKRMPPSWSDQAKQVTQAERDTLVAWARGNAGNRK
jgi:hypothetical protein